MDNENDDISCGWPGDGSGEDDLADYNTDEADDYRGECDDGGGDEGERDGDDGDWFNDE